MENLRLDNRRLELEIEKIKAEMNYYQSKALYVQAKLQSEFNVSFIVNES